MNVALILCLCPTLPTQLSTLDNLAFQSGTLAEWEGRGFTIAPAEGSGPSLHFGVCSADLDPKGHKALLHRAFVVPQGVGALRCTAQVVRGKDCKSNDNLDVVLLAAGKRILPKMVRIDGDWKPVGTVLPALHRRSREYLWPLEGYVGQPLRLALIDEDDRRGCYLMCSGFQFVSANEYYAKEFSQFMHRLADQNNLSPAVRFETQHFLAFSNADDAFTERRLNDCELIYELFFTHFRKKGFHVRDPESKLMVAIFESQAGFEAYLGQPLPPGILGVYVPESNRLVVYDVGRSREYAARKQRNRDEVRNIGSDLDRHRVLETANRHLSELRTQYNVGEVMHETAHQLSFNCGLFNRRGDIPRWAAEGLATYCEATDNGSWQGFGEPNPERLKAWAAILEHRAPGSPWLSCSRRIAA